MALPFGIGLGIFVSDVNRRKLPVVVNAGVWACWMLPVRAWQVLPPLPRVISVAEFGRYLEHHGPRLAHVLWQAGDQLWVDRPLCHCDIASGFHEGCKF